MDHSQNNRFQDFFGEEKYVALKNHLYNYLLRKRAVERTLKKEKTGLTLEVGSGISPMMTCTNQIVYSDLSLLALQILKHTHKKGCFVVADSTCLPFKSGAFNYTICSEVLEHLPDDQKALEELARVMKPSGLLTVTFPHQKFYFASDDRFVKHFRRYELPEMETLLNNAGLRPVSTEKILGPLEKLTMRFVIVYFSLIQKLKFPKNKGMPYSRTIISFFKWVNLLYAGLAWLDAKIMPRFLSTVLLVKAKKD